MRQDISVAQQLVQSNHATFEAARSFPSQPETIPSCIVIGVPDKTALYRVVEKLHKHDIRHQAFHEPDFDMGLSAVATAPLAQEQRRLLSNYRLWKEQSNASN